MYKRQVYAFPLAQPREVNPITSFKTHPERFLSMSDGGTLCYGYDDEIYTQQPDATPKKVAIEIVRDDQPQFANLQSSDGATSAVVSPDGKDVYKRQDNTLFQLLICTIHIASGGMGKSVSV